MRWQVWAALGLIVLLAGLWVDNSLQPPRAPPPPTTPMPDPCAEAVEQVRAYQAPGQRLPVGAMVPLMLASDPRPTEIHGWRRDRCEVYFEFTRGNVLQLAIWRYTPRTGHVEAREQLARQLSGWE